jgi:hypothetical protein
VLVSAAHLRIVGIDPRTRIGASVDVGGAEQDLGEAFQSGALAGGFRAHQILDRVIGGGR